MAKKPTVIFEGAEEMVLIPQDDARTISLCRSNLLWREEARRADLERERGRTVRVTNRFEQTDSRLTIYSTYTV